MTDILSRGERARLLLESALLREVLNALDGHYTQAWRQAQSAEAREDCHRYVCLTEKFIADLTSVATTGALEQLRLKELEGVRKGHLSWPKI